MKFKEFADWCNKRACDGCWGMFEAMTCADLMKTVNKIPFWKREKAWRMEYEQRVILEIINPIEKRMAEIYGKIL